MKTIEAKAAPDLGKTPGLAKAIARRLQDGVLPGEAKFSRSDLDAAVALVLKAAQRRPNGDMGLAHETISDGEHRYTRFALINDDMPFLVDSIAGVFAAHGLAIDRLVHPIVQIVRDKARRLTGIDKSGTPESLIYLEAPRADARTRRAVIDDLRTSLGAVRAAVTDWPAMQAAMQADADRLEDQEGAELLRWLGGGMLTQLGHVVRGRDAAFGDPLGICRPGGPELLSPESYDAAFAWFADSARQAPLIVKSSVVSAVHRRVPLDLFIVPVFKQGKVAALSIHAGIWTSAGLATPPTQVPQLRLGLAHLMKKLGFDPRGHAGKALTHALTSLPHDLLIGFAPADLARVTTAMMSLVDRPRPKVVLVCSALERHLFAFAWVPRDAISTGVRLQVMAMIEEATGTSVLDWSLEVEGNSLALLRFSLDIAACRDTPDEATLDAALTSLVRGWPDAVEAELRAFAPDGRAAAIAVRYAEAFPQGYRNHYGPAEAAQDIMRLYASGDGSSARLHALSGDAAGEVRVKLYRRGGTLTLSDAVPALENFGFKVIEEVSTLLADGTLGAIHDFRLVPPPSADVLARASEIEAALAAVIDGTAEDDAFNRLIVATALSAQEANGLRACFRYLRQTGLTYAIATAVDALQHAPAVTRGILDLFMARHDPRFPGNRDKAEAKAATRIHEGLAGVAAINDDRLLRQFRSLIEAILRTNAFVPAGRESPDTALAFKFDSALVPGLPRPVPWREIFVYSRRVEGIHLRAGPIARGGLRWSDRRDDYRTEVLGLMKAQRVKNAVIVPTGAKGGFYPKQLPSPATHRDGWLAEGKASYQVFVRALLSLTDNIVGDKVVHPAGIVIRDAPDPYFVVAADKGTATYSDTANALAAEAGFWLDDAFASGGSKGYDHKAMGITARGAWLSVQRHFLELGMDVQTDPVRVVGCGDMSGDVFGNGMLLSKSLKLVAAFDHRHIFLDPEPDGGNSWAERARLFALPRSSWADYDPALISPGGGVFPRTQKAIPLSPEIRGVLGIAAETADPDTLISAILTAPVDLLWFGGIGTYVKAAGENNVQVGDPANDAVRVDGGTVRARVIGEGANLGCTQAGRIEFALAGSDGGAAGGGGGKLNTDFIDNSAGVDCSDHEVNIKIALAAARRSGRLTEPARVKLLGAMTDDVAAHVLEDNRLQALALSIAEARGPRAVGAQVRLIETLEETGQLDRKTEGLADSPTLLRRAADGAQTGGGGLTRPELAVLLSSSKLALQAAIEASALPDDPGFAGDLLAAFPAAMRRKFEGEILGHRLRREIVATALANRIVNRLGMINPFELAEEEGVGLAQVAAAFAAAERLFGMGAIWQALETAAIPESARVLLFHGAAVAIRGHMASLIRSGGGSLAVTELADTLAPAVRKIDAQVASVLTGEALAQSRRLRAELANGGAPEAEANMVVRLFDLSGAIGLAQLASAAKQDPLRLTHAYVRLGEALALDWAQAAADRLSPSDPWERLLVAGLARDFQQMRLDFLRRPTRRADPPLEVVQKWLEQHDSAVRRFRAILSRAQAAAEVTPAMLARIAAQARAILGQ
ncbi:MAG: NAD-glutamate dehydrogenase domain-containing protein [Novosphingobium sp.]